ncbi:MAG: CgeB family protein [Gammaproteobacteria bacterium]
MLILLAKMGQSPYNRSIWEGLARGFHRLGHTVQVLDAEQIPDPETWSVPPALLFAVHGGNLPVDIVDRYRSRGIATAVYLLDEPYEVAGSSRWARHYEWVFTVDRATVVVHAPYAKAAHLPLAYDDEVFHPRGAAIASDILVLGSPFPAREVFLAPIRDRYGDRITWVGPGWRRFSPAGRHMEGFVTPEDCARFYRGAKVVLNIHRDSFWSHFGELNPERIAATHLNPRFWEVVGCGAFQLCSFRDDLEVFAPRAGVGFGSPEELERRLDRFLGDRRARRDAARRLRARLKGHTYRGRASTALEAMGLVGDHGLA